MRGGLRQQCAAKWHNSLRFADLAGTQNTPSVGYLVIVQHSCDYLGEAWRHPECKFSSMFWWNFVFVGSYVLNVKYFLAKREEGDPSEEWVNVAVLGVAGTQVEGTLGPLLQTPSPVSQRQHQNEEERKWIRKSKILLIHSFLHLFLKDVQLFISIVSSHFIEVDFDINNSYSVPNLGLLFCKGLSVLTERKRMLEYF